ncbi:MAG TPA: hypothetical protein VJQ25_05075, partial [Nitrospira sp.]|nr:hypothetical protein [Nitrospira sp.]
MNASVLPMEYAQLELASVLATVLACSVLGTAFMRYLAGRFNWVVAPRSDRWHKQPTALHGGVGFFPAFLLGAAWLVVRNEDLRWFDASAWTALSDQTRLAGALLSGSLLMFLFGLWDDLKQSR